MMGVHILNEISQVSSDHDKSIHIIKSLNVDELHFAFNIAKQ